jgi:hypothetical protein
MFLFLLRIFSGIKLDSLKFFTDLLFSSSPAVQGNRTAAERWSQTHWPQADWSERRAGAASGRIVRIAAVNPSL